MNHVNGNQKSSFYPCLNIAFSVSNIQKSDFALLAAMPFFPVKWKMIDSIKPCVVCWCSLHSYVHRWCRYDVKWWSFNFSFCSCHKAGCHFSLKRFRRHEIFTELKDFEVAAVQKPCVWQNSKKCLSTYVDKPFINFYVWFVKRAHHFEFFWCSPCTCYKLARYKIALSWCIATPFYQSASQNWRVQYLQTTELM